MDKFEERRLNLLKLVTEMGHGGRQRVAHAIQKSPSYVARMLYPKDKEGKKGIGEDSVELLDKAFPGWRPMAGESGHLAAQREAVYQVKQVAWPFRTISPDEWTRIPKPKREFLEEQIKALVPLIEANSKAA